MILQRGTTYTFIVEGGNTANNSAKNHPFYITNSSSGGYGQSSEIELIYAGVDEMGQATAGMTSIATARPVARGKGLLRVPQQ